MGLFVFCFSLLLVFNHIMRLRFAIPVGYMYISPISPALARAFLPLFDLTFFFAVFDTYINISVKCKIKAPFGCS